MLRPYKRYADFRGRSTRTEYWLFVLFYLIVYVACLLVGTASGSENASVALASLFALGSLVPSLAVAVRRLHDTDRSGWNILWGFLPIVGTIVVLVFLCLPSTPGTNRFGPPDDPNFAPDA